MTDRATAREASEPLGADVSAQDAADIALCRKILAESGPGVTHDQFMAILEDEDAAQA